MGQYELSIFVMNIPHFQKQRKGTFLRFGNAQSRAWSNFEKSDASAEPCQPPTINQFLFRSKRFQREGLMWHRPNKAGRMMNVKRDVTGGPSDIPLSGASIFLGGLPRSASFCGTLSKTLRRPAKNDGGVAMRNRREGMSD